MHELAERAAEAVAEASLRPPVDVWGLAEKFGITVLERAIWGDGRLVHRDCGVEIQVSCRTTPARRRFTIAHELGHLWALHEGLGGGRLSHADEERFCNAFAAALLIPHTWLGTNAMGQPQDLPTLCRLARQAQTSVSAMLLRLRAKVGWGATLLRFRRESGHWRLASVVGCSTTARTRLSVTAHTDAVLRPLSVDSRIVRVALPLEVDDLVVRCEAELSPGAHSALALTRLRLPRRERSESLPGNDLAWRLWSLTTEASRW